MIRAVAWHVARPRFYPELMRQFGRHILALALSNMQKKAAQESLRWCRSVCVETPEALRAITGVSEHKSVAQLFPEQLDFAARIQAECPIMMGGGANTDLLYHLNEHARATRVVETGVAYGWSSLAILLSLEKRQDSQLFSTDRPYPKSQSEQYVGCVVPNSLKEHWKITRLPDREALPEILEEAPFDLCHYDSDKSTSGRHWAYPRLWSALRPGGVFVSDDINDDLAFREFAESVGVSPTVVRTPQSRHDKFVGVLIKPEA